MLIKTTLYFREVANYTNSDGESMLRVRFLDDNDESFTFFFPDNEENKKFKSMKRDNPVNLDLSLYRSNKGKYNLYVQ